MSNNNDQFSDDPRGNQPWLHSLLNQVFGDSVTSLKVEPITSDTHETAGYMADVYRIHLTGDSLPASIILKTQAADPIRARMAEQFQSYNKEAQFYKTLAQTSLCQTPLCYYNDPAQFLLMLEDLTPQSQVIPAQGASPRQSREAIMSLALVHASQPQSQTALPEFSDGFTAAASDMQTFGRQALNQLATSPAVNFMKHYTESSLDFLPLFQERQMVFSHMDYRNDNLAYTDRGVIAFDWGEFSFAPPGFDFACYMVTSISAKDRQALEAELLDGYIDVTNRHGNPIRRDELRASYLLSIPPSFYLAALVLDRGEYVKGHHLANLCLSALEDHLTEIQRLYGTV